MLAETRGTSAKRMPQQTDAPYEDVPAHSPEETDLKVGIHLWRKTRWSGWLNVSTRPHCRALRSATAHMRILPDRFNSSVAEKAWKDVQSASSHLVIIMVQSTVLYLAFQDSIWRLGAHVNGTNTNRNRRHGNHTNSSNRCKWYMLCGTDRIMPGLK